MLHEPRPPAKKFERSVRVRRTGPGIVLCEPAGQLRKPGFGPGVLGGRSQQDAQSEEIALAAGRLALDQLWGEEAQSADDQIGTGYVGRVLEAREPEVRQAGVAMAVEQHVAALDVAVEDAVVVYAGDCGEELEGERLDGGGRQAATIQTLAQRCSVDVLHNQVGLIGSDAVVVDLHEVGVLDAGMRARLARKPGDGCGARRERIRDDLDSHRALKPFVVGAPHRCHAAGTGDPVEAVAGADQLPRAERPRQMLRVDCEVSHPHLCSNRRGGHRLRHAGNGGCHRQTDGRRCVPACGAREPSGRDRASRVSRSAASSRSGGGRGSCGRG